MARDTTGMEQLEAGPALAARTPDADEPAPLDDGLPPRGPLLGPRGCRLLWGLGLLALAFRLVLLPIGHAWDLTTAYNTFIDIARGHSPYDTIRYLSHLAQSAQWGFDYEYYAYPPVPLYLYFPLAKLFAALHPQMTYFFPASSSLSMPTLPWDFYFFYKLPIWIADFLLAALLARVTGTIRGFRDYLLNPYVLLVSGAWTFDAVMVLGLVAGVYLLQRGRFGWAGLALAFGTMVKFFPIIVVPTCALYLIKKKRRVRELALFLGVYGLACLILLGPYADGVLYVLQFHASRTGGGMNWEMIWQYPQAWKRFTFIPPTIGMAFAEYGTLTLAIALLLAYWYVFTREMSFNRMIIVTLLAFYLGSKLVNEQYALMIFPFALVEAYRLGGAWRHFQRLLWVIPLAFTVMHVPIDHFVWLFYHTVLGAQINNFVASTQLTGFESGLTPWDSSRVDILSVAFLGVAFFVLCLVAVFWPVRPVSRRPGWRRVSRPVGAEVERQAALVGAGD